MNLYEQRAFKKAHLEAKKRVKETEADHVILFIPNRITSQRFQIFKAESFFKKNLNHDYIMCYLAHP